MITVTNFPAGRHVMFALDARKVTRLDDTRPVGQQSDHNVEMLFRVQTDQYQSFDYRSAICKTESRPSCYYL